MTNEQEVMELAKQHGAVVGVKHILDTTKEGIFFSGDDELSAFAQAIRDQEASKVAMLVREKQEDAVKDAMELLLKHGEDHDWRIIAKNMGNGSWAELRNAKEVHDDQR